VLNSRMIIKQDGKVGIGTTTPENQLSIGDGGIGINRTGDNPYVNFSSGDSIKAALFFDVAMNRLVLRNQHDEPMMSSLIAVAASASAPPLLGHTNLQ